MRINIWIEYNTQFILKKDENIGAMRFQKSLIINTIGQNLKSCKKKINHA